MPGVGQLWMGMGRSGWFGENFEERSYGATDGLDRYPRGRDQLQEIASMGPAWGTRVHSPGGDRTSISLGSFLSDTDILGRTHAYDVT